MEKLKANNVERNEESLKKYVKAGCITGCIIGTMIFPVVGTKAVGMAGGYLSYELGKGVHSFKHHHNDQCTVM